jgi:hypothetical protein
MPASYPASLPASPSRLSSDYLVCLPVCIFSLSYSRSAFLLFFLLWIIRGCACASILLESLEMDVGQISAPSLRRRFQWPHFWMHFVYMEAGTASLACLQCCRQIKTCACKCCLAVTVSLNYLHNSAVDSIEAAFVKAIQLVSMYKFMEDRPVSAYCLPNNAEDRLEAVLVQAIQLVSVYSTWRLDLSRPPTYLTTLRTDWRLCLCKLFSWRQCKY